MSYAKVEEIAINIPSITYEGDYKCLYADVINQMRDLGFIMRCDIIWHKQNISKRTAWGSWKSPSNPHVVQPYEYVLVFSKDDKKHVGKEENIDITKNEFISLLQCAMGDPPPTPRPVKIIPRPSPENWYIDYLNFILTKKIWSWICLGVQVPLPL